MLALTLPSTQGISLTGDNQEFIRTELETHFEQLPVLPRRR